MASNYIDLPAYGNYHWKAPVDTAVDLPASGNSLGDARATEDTGNIYVWNGSAWITGGGSSGTVTSVGLADGSTTPIFTITGSPVTGSGTLTETLKTQTANTGFFGPTSGAAAQPTFRTQVTEDLPDPAKYLNLIEDFSVGFVSTGGGNITAEHNWFTWTSGASPSYRLNTGAVIPSTALNPGVLQMSVTTNADSAGLFTGNSGLDAAAAWYVTGGVMSLTYVFKINALNNGTDNQTIVLGFMDGMPVNGSTNYMRFQYDSSSLNWQAFTRNGGSATSTTVATIAVTTAWHKATVSVDATGSTVTYTMDGVLLATHTTNIPTGHLSLGFNIQKTLGSGNALTCAADLIVARKTLTTSR